VNPVQPSGQRRLRGMVRKEWLQILRDPSSIAIAFVLPVVLLFLFGYGVSLDAKDIRLGLVIEQTDHDSLSLLQSFRNSHYFVPVYFRNMQNAERALTRRELDGIVWLRHDFSRRLLKDPPAAIAVRVNGVDANQARITAGYIQGVWFGWLEKYARAHGQKLKSPVQMEHRIWFNPAVISRQYLVPGLIAIIMTLIGSLLTSMVVAREWERGTMEAVMATPLRVREMLAGKLVPYFFLGMAGMLFTVTLARWLFDVPLRGSFSVLLLAGGLFMLVALAMGLLISIVSKNQFVAGQVAIIATFLPAFILSGFIFDIGSMPGPVQAITHIVPARYFVSILQTLFLAGDIWPVILPNLGAMLLMLLVFLAIIRRKANKRLT